MDEQNDAEREFEELNNDETLFNFGGKSMTPEDYEKALIFIQENRLHQVGAIAYKFRKEQEAANRKDTYVKKEVESKVFNLSNLFKLYSKTVSFKKKPKEQQPIVVAANEKDLSSDAKKTTGEVDSKNKKNLDEEEDLSKDKSPSGKDNLNGVAFEKDTTERINDDDRNDIKDNLVENTDETNDIIGVKENIEIRIETSNRIDEESTAKEGIDEDRSEEDNSLKENIEDKKLNDINNYEKQIPDTDNRKKENEPEVIIDGKNLEIIEEAGTEKVINKPKEIIEDTGILKLQQPAIIDNSNDTLKSLKIDTPGKMSEPSTDLNRNNMEQITEYISKSTTIDIYPNSNKSKKTLKAEKEEASVSNDIEEKKNTNQTIDDKILEESQNHPNKLADDKKIDNSIEDSEGIPVLEDTEGIPVLEDTEGIPVLEDTEGILVLENVIIPKYSDQKIITDIAENNEDLSIKTEIISDKDNNNNNKNQLSKDITKINSDEKNNSLKLKSETEELNEYKSNDELDSAKENSEKNNQDINNNKLNGIVTNQQENNNNEHDIPIVTNTGNEKKITSENFNKLKINLIKDSLLNFIKTKSGKKKEEKSGSDVKTIESEPTVTPIGNDLTEQKISKLIDKDIRTTDGNNKKLLKIKLNDAIQNKKNNNSDKKVDKIPILSKKTKKDVNFKILKPELVDSSIKKNIDSNDKEKNLTQPEEIKSKIKKKLSDKMKENKLKEKEKNTESIKNSKDSLNDKLSTKNLGQNTSQNLKDKFKDKINKKALDMKKPIVAKSPVTHKNEKLPSNKKVPSQKKSDSMPILNTIHQLNNKNLKSPTPSMKTGLSKPVKKHVSFVDLRKNSESMKTMMTNDDNYLITPIKIIPIREKFKGSKIPVLFPNKLKLKNFQSVSVQTENGNLSDVHEKGNLYNVHENKSIQPKIISTNKMIIPTMEIKSPIQNIIKNNRRKKNYFKKSLSQPVMDFSNISYLYRNRPWPLTGKYSRTIDDDNENIIFGSSNLSDHYNSRSSPFYYNSPESPRKLYKSDPILRKSRANRTTTTSNDISSRPQSSEGLYSNNKQPRISSLSPKPYPLQPSPAVNNEKRRTTRSPIKTYIAEYSENSDNYFKSTDPYYRKAASSDPSWNIVGGSEGSILRSKGYHEYKYYNAMPLCKRDRCQALCTCLNKSTSSIPYIVSPWKLQDYFKPPRKKETLESVLTSHNIFLDRY